MKILETANFDHITGVEELCGSIWVLFDAGEKVIELQQNGETLGYIVPKGSLIGDMVAGAEAGK